jgi:hypothetical protein
MVDECSVAVEDWRSGIQCRAAERFCCCCVALLLWVCLETELDMDISNTTKSSTCDSESREFRRVILDSVCYTEV